MFCELTIGELDVLISALSHHSRDLRHSAECFRDNRDFIHARIWDDMDATATHLYKLAVDAWIELKRKECKV